MAEGVCTHPNCERHGKSPVVGIGCDGNEAVRAASGPLTASGGQSGVRVTPRGAGEAYSGAEGVGAEERTGRLAEVLQEVWMAGEQLNMAKPVGERIDWEMFARAIERRLPQVSAVDTALEHLVGRWLQRTQNDDPRLADKLMNEVATVVRGAR